MAESKKENNNIAKKTMTAGVEVLKELNDEIISLFGLYSGMSAYDMIVNELKQNFDKILDYIQELKKIYLEGKPGSSKDIFSNLSNFYDLNIKKALTIHQSQLEDLRNRVDKTYKNLADNVVNKYKHINNLILKLFIGS